MKVEKPQGRIENSAPGFQVFPREASIPIGLFWLVDGSSQYDVALKETGMKQDPFGSLNEWGRVLKTLDELAQKGNLQQCQPGLIRILRFKGNWRLREETLRRLGTIQTPSDELVNQVVNILADDNVYFDARILAAEALRQIIHHTKLNDHVKTTTFLRNITERLRNTMQPFAFDNALRRLHQDLCLLTM